MRLLKQSTVTRELERRGWVRMDNVMPSPESAVYMMDGSGGSRLFADVCKGRVKIHDGRLRGHSNVHIVTYLGPFKSKAAMYEGLDKAQMVYEELCGTAFPHQRPTGSCTTGGRGRGRDA